MCLCAFNLIALFIALFGDPQGAAEHPDRIGNAFLVNVGFFGLGYWMYSSAKKKAKAEEVAKTGVDDTKAD